MEHIGLFCAASDRLDLIYSLTILGIDTNLQFVFKGIIIITAVTLDCLKYVQKK